MTYMRDLVLVYWIFFDIFMINESILQVFCRSHFDSTCGLVVVFTKFTLKHDIEQLEVAF